MGSIADQTVVCKCLNKLNISDDDYFIFNHGIKKLTLVKAVKLLIDANLNKRTDLDDITFHLGANEALQEAIDLKSISSSQLGRTLGYLPLDVLQEIFLYVNQQLQSLLRHRAGIPGIGKLRIMDSTSITLPRIAGDWAYYSKGDNGVKIHTQLLVVDPDTVYADKIVCSTRGIADSEVAMELVVDDDAIHVMDRGYIVFSHYKHWRDNQIRFVARIQNRNKTTILRERDVNKEAGVLRDTDVTVTYKDSKKNEVTAELRLVEFTDEKGRYYRVLTSVWDLTAEQISEIYHHRWKIELFFKWVKQHLSFVHLFSNNPNAVWNQIYLSLITQGLMILIKEEARTTKTVWQTLKLMRAYMSQPWEVFVTQLNRPPSKKSKGRQRSKTGSPLDPPKERQSVKIIVN